jgi:hypothetical protein
VSDVLDAGVDGRGKIPENGEVKTPDVITAVDAGAVNKLGLARIVSSVVTSTTVEEWYPRETVWVSVTTETKTVATG